MTRFEQGPKGLRYVSDSDPGLSRRRSGAGFSYRDATGGAVRDKPTLARIRGLAIPPAWTDVWICSDARGHVQATGRDARGRKQHRYHPDFRAHREEAKFERLSAFADALPALRARVDRDLRKQRLSRDKVAATVVRLLDTTLIRIGNEEYARKNKSYGLTTLETRHAAVAGDALRLTFTGKSGKSWRLTLRDRRVVGVVRRLQELPGQRLFQYLDGANELQPITSSDVNDYLRLATGADITAKDFRTWGGAVLAAAALSSLDPGPTQALTKANIKAAIERVSQTLGNTPAICRKCYIHPAIIDAYLDHRFTLKPAKKLGLTPHEASVRLFLIEASRARPAPGSR